MSSIINSSMSLTMDADSAETQPVNGKATKTSSVILESSTVKNTKLLSNEEKITPISINEQEQTTQKPVLNDEKTTPKYIQNNTTTPKSILSEQRTPPTAESSQNSIPFTSPTDKTELDEVNSPTTNCKLAVLGEPVAKGPRKSLRSAMKNGKSKISNARQASLLSKFLKVLVKLVR